MTELEKYLQSYFGLAGEEMSEIVSLFKSTLLKKGDYYLKIGKSCDKMSFIQSGFLRMYVAMEDKEVTQWISSKGYFITELASFTFGTPSRWNIQALADTELYTIGKEDYDSIAGIVPRWPEIERQFIVQCFIMMENRLFGHLSMPADQRYSAFFDQHKDLFNQVPLQYIASMLGMTPETFSRIRKKHQSMIS
jgi:CRP/FNR family transcriptional regulator, anaerobic regulatory protein